LRLLAKLAFLVAAASLSAQQEPQSADSLSREVKEVFQRAAPCVVRLHASDQHGELCGTGFFVDPTGTIYTSYSVGGEADDFAVEFKGKRYPARQLVADIRSGLAILKVDLTTPCLPIGKSDELEVATPVVTIGFPLDLDETPNFGMIAGFDHKYLGRYFSTTHLRVNATIQRGEMGAPLLNLKGEVVGVVVSSVENGSSCYAVPVEAAEKIQRDFVRFGEVRHGWIGANVREASARVQGSRAEITDLSAAPPASDSGLRPGDILLQVGKVKVHEPEDVLDASFFLTAGDAVPITVMRGDQKITVNVQADFHPISKNVPLLQDGTQLPMLAAPTQRGMAVNLESVPAKSP
jgi:serine protease Do